MFLTQFYLNIAYKFLIMLKKGVWAGQLRLKQNHELKYIQIEKQICKLSGRSFSQSEMLNRLNNTCIKLIKSIVSHENHPLRQLFLTRNSSNYSLRSRFSLLPLNSSGRLMKTFIRFYKNS